MYICNCNAITESEILGAAELGCSTLADLRRDLGVATCCGKCAPEASKLIRRCARSAGGCPNASPACSGGDD
jgi:bacterioferritin-associated ferredoxin